MTSQGETVDMRLSQAREKMHKAVAVCQEEFSRVRTGRASPSLVQKILVDYYGTKTPLGQLASFTVPEPRLLVVHPYDRNVMAAVEKAISSSELGVTPSNDGSVIRLAFPSLTEERRKEFIKTAHARAEEGRVAVRNIRRHLKEELEHLQKEAKLSEDDLHRAEKELQKLTDQQVGEIDQMLERKEKELLEI